MSLKKWMAVLHAVIIGSVFLPWSNSVEFGYANMITRTDLQFGYNRAAGWVMIATCIMFYLIEVFLKNYAHELVERLQFFVIWALVFIAVSETFSISFLSRNGLHVPEFGLIFAFVAAVIQAVIYNKKQEV